LCCFVVFVDVGVVVVGGCCCDVGGIGVVFVIVECCVGVDGDRGAICVGVVVFDDGGVGGGVVVGNTGCWCVRYDGGCVVGCCGVAMIVAGGWLLLYW